MEKEGKRVKILFTGFEPFGGSCENPSYDCLKGLPCTVGETELVTAKLPVSFRRAPALLLERMGEERPDAVVCLGLAAGRKKSPWKRSASTMPMLKFPTTTATGRWIPFWIRMGPRRIFPVCRFLRWRRL